MDIKKGKKIVVFLVDGLPKGIREAKIDQWNGRAMCSPRNRLKDLLSMDDICDMACVYFLIGESNDSGLIEVYVGEADGFKNRIRSHDSKKTSWKDVVVFYSPELTKASVKYLESICVERLKKAGKCILENITSPAKPTVPKEDISGLEIFYENIALIMPLFGFDIFVQQQSKVDISKTLFINRKGVKAKGILLADGKLSVLKGSEAVVTNTSSFKKHSYSRLKEVLKEKRRLMKQGDRLVFTDDYVFDSSSAAAAIVLANPSSGPAEWKNKNGKTLKSILEAI